MPRLDLVKVVGRSSIVDAPFDVRRFLFNLIRRHDKPLHRRACAFSQKAPQGNDKHPRDGEHEFAHPYIGPYQDRRHKTHVFHEPQHWNIKLDVRISGPVDYVAAAGHHTIHGELCKEKTRPYKEAGQKQDVGARRWRDDDASSVESDVLAQNVNHQDADERQRHDRAKPEIDPSVEWQGKHVKTNVFAKQRVKRAERRGA